MEGENEGEENQDNLMNQGAQPGEDEKSESELLNE